MTQALQGRQGSCIRARLPQAPQGRQEAGIRVGTRRRHKPAWWTKRTDSPPAGRKIMSRNSSLGGKAVRPVRPVAHYTGMSGMPDCVQGLVFDQPDLARALRNCRFQWATHPLTAMLRAVCRSGGAGYWVCGTWAVVVPGTG